MSDLQLGNLIVNICYSSFSTQTRPKFYPDKYSRGWLCLHGAAQKFCHLFTLQYNFRARYDARTNSENETSICQNFIFNRGQTGTHSTMTFFSRFESSCVIHRMRQRALTDEIHKQICCAVANVLLYSVTNVGTDCSWLDERTDLNNVVGTIMINQQRCSYMIEHVVRE